MADCAPSHVFRYLVVKEIGMKMAFWMNNAHYIKLSHLLAGKFAFSSSDQLTLKSLDLCLSCFKEPPYMQLMR